MRSFDPSPGGPSGGGFSDASMGRALRPRAGWRGLPRSRRPKPGSHPSGGSRPRGRLHGLGDHPLREAELGPVERAEEDPVLDGFEDPFDLRQLPRLFLFALHLCPERPAAEEPDRSLGQRLGVPMDELDGFLPPGAGVHRAPEDDGRDVVQVGHQVNGGHVRGHPELVQAVGDRRRDPPGRSVLARVRHQHPHHQHLLHVSLTASALRGAPIPPTVPAGAGRPARALGPACGPDFLARRGHERG